MSPTARTVRALLSAAKIAVVVEGGGRGWSFNVPDRATADLVSAVIPSANAYQMDDGSWTFRPGTPTVDVDINSVFHPMHY